MKQRAMKVRQRFLIPIITSALMVFSPLLLAQTITPTTITIGGGSPVCRGESESFPVQITLPEAALVDKVDVFLLFDDTGSFASFVPQVATIFSNLVSSLETSLPGVEFGFGVGRFEDYGGPGTGFSGESQAGRPFVLNQPIITAATAGGADARNTLISAALARGAPGFGGDGPETALDGLFRVATGTGFDGDGDGSFLGSGPAGGIPTQTNPGLSGDVPPFSSNVALASGGIGGAGFRSDSLRLVLLATDICSVSAFPATAPIPGGITGAGGSSEPVTAFACTSTTPGDNRFGFVSDSKTFPGNTIVGAVAPSGAGTVQETVSALNSLGVRVLGMGPGAAPTTSPGPSFTPSVLLSALARLTGGVDANGNPLVFDTAVPLADLTNAIVDAIRTSATTPVDITLSTGGLPPGLSFSFNPPQVDDVPPGGTASFTAIFTGDGSPVMGSFDLNFIDSASGAVLGRIPVTVDCSACSIACPEDLSVPNDPGQCGAIVNYTRPTGGEGCNVVCTPDTGTFFPIGTTTVNCTAGGGSDGGSQSSCSFTVTVRDTEQPRITCPQDLTVSTTGASCSAEANYVLASATDNCPGVTVICLPPSGATFPIGTQSVNCTATDSAGNTSTCSFTVTIRDGTPPVVTCPTTPVNVDAGNNCAASMPDIRSTVTATDDCTPAASLTFTQSIPVGAPLPPGQTIVAVTVRDSGGNTVICQVTVNVTGGPPANPVIEPATVNLDPVNVLKKAKKKKKKVKPAQATGSFTVRNPSCAPLTLTFSALRRVTDQGRFRNPDDRQFFSVFLRNPDGSAGEELIGRNVPEGRQVTIAPDDSLGFIVRFEPAIPAVTGCTDDTCLRASDVLPNNFVSELVFGGTGSTVRFNASVGRGVRLVDPQNPGSDTPVVTLCRSGDEFIVRYHVFSPDKSDVRTVRYEFLDGSGGVVSTVDNVDLAGPLSQSNVVNGQTFNVEHAFNGANSNEQVNRVRVTVSGSNSSSTATSTSIGTNCGTTLQMLLQGQSSTLILPVARLGGFKP